MGLPGADLQRGTRGSSLGIPARPMAARRVGPLGPRLRTAGVAGAAGGGRS